MRGKVNEESFYYDILNPGGNKTAIVLGNVYSEGVKKKINEYILSNNKDVEQVGFICKSEKRLEMAGGEFCLNATRCAIWKYLNGEKGELKLSVSGCDEMITGGIKENKEVYANLSINKNLKDIIETNGIYNFVKLDGILLAVVNAKDSVDYITRLKENEEVAKAKLKEKMKVFETDEKAVGIILLGEDDGKIKINPIIWVKEVDTLYYETACGTGSLATAIYKNYVEGKNMFKIFQPSGYSMSIQLIMDKEKIKSAIVSGIVKEEVKRYECKRDIRRFSRV